MSLSEQIRKAVRAYGSIYAVCRDSGIPQPTLQRFMAEKRDMYLATAERLCEFFGMRLTRPKQKRDPSPWKRRS